MRLAVLSGVPVKMLEAVLIALSTEVPIVGLVAVPIGVRLAATAGRLFMASHSASCPASPAA
ncbi:MAG: hypothetical protein ABW210_05550 [Achromobacter sp.]